MFIQIKSTTNTTISQPLLYLQVDILNNLIGSVDILVITYV